MQVYDKQYINGEWLTGSGQSELENRNPYTSEVLYTYQSASKEDVDKAYQAAKKAQPGWAALSPTARNQYLERFLQVMIDSEAEMRAISIEEGGSAQNKVAFEVGTTRAIVKEALSFGHHSEGTILPSDIPGKNNLVIREPKGVIGVIAPWNVPFVLALRSVIPALATGNTVVLKPASNTPATALFMAKLFDEAGFPKGVFNAVVGKGSEIGDSITEHPIPNAISFTGSTEVGQNIGRITGENIKDVSLELGGNNVQIVLADADIDKAAKAAVFGSFFNAGQVCMRINRLVVDASVHDEFVAAFVTETQKISAGDPNDPNNFYGPIIDAHERDKVNRLIQETLAAGASAALEGQTNGNVITPWILTNVTNEMPAAKYEVFGPAVSIIKVQDEAEAIAVANDTQYGLSGSVFTEDLYHGIQVAKQIESGMVHVNDQPINDEPHVMFGGMKQSGLGRFNSRWVADKFTTERWISVQEKGRF